MKRTRTREQELQALIREQHRRERIRAYQKEHYKTPWSKPRRAVPDMVVYPIPSNQPEPGQVQFGMTSTVRALEEEEISRLLNGGRFGGARDKWWDLRSAK